MIDSKEERDSEDEGTLVTMNASLTIPSELVGEKDKLLVITNRSADELFSILLIDQLDHFHDDPEGFFGMFHGSARYFESLKENRGTIANPR